MDPRALQLSARAAEHLRAALFLILPAASALALPAAAAEGDPEPPVSIGALRAAAGERVDHGTADDGAVWSRAASYRAGFERGGTSFVPFLGSRAPRNFPVRFRLESIARGGAAVAFDADVAPERTEDTVHFARGGVVEVYELRPAQVEQLFVLGALPAAGGDLVLSIGVDTELEGGTTADGIEFRNTLGAVRYGAAVAIDATGRRVEAPTAYADGAIEIRVPGAWLAHARMPLTIDPVISTFAVDATTEDDFAPAS